MSPKKFAFVAVFLVKKAHSLESGLCMEKSTVFFKDYSPSPAAAAAVQVMLAMPLTVATSSAHCTPI